MNRGTDHRPVFLSDHDRVEFGRLLSDVADRFGVTTLAYCLLDNHYHLVVHCPEGNLSAAMQHLGSVYTQRINGRAERDGPLFRGRFHSIPVTTDRYLLIAVRYVHRNALDVSGVDDVAAYRWSSHRAYLGHRRAADFLDTDRVLAYFGGDADRFHSFVAGPERPERERLPAADLDTVLSVVDLFVAKASLRTDGPAKWLERIVLTVLLDLIPPDEHDRLATRIGEPSSRTRQRARRRAADDPVVRHLVDAVCAEVELAVYRAA